MSHALALIGDYSPEVVAHRAIPRGLELARQEIGCDVTWSWLATRDLHDADQDLAAFDGLWVVPASPYENMAGALDAIRWGRENRKPMLGSCGGFQHMLIEFARHVAGLPEADHAETNPHGPTLVVAQLSCSLDGKAGRVHFTSDSRLRAIYGRDSADEGYRCSYGLNPAYAAALEQAGLRFTARDDAGDIRAAELPESVHPFFLGTLFQSERAALRGEIPPPARALLKMISKR